MGALDQILSGLLELAGLSITGKDPDEFTVIIDGKEIKMMSGRLLRTMDTAADGWTASRDFDPYDDKISGKFIPYQYLPAQVYLGGKLGLNSILYTTTPRIKPDGREIDLEGWTPTADIIDTTINVKTWTQFPGAKYEKNNVTLADRAIELLEPMGLSVVDDVNDNEPFDRVKATPTEKIFDHLAKMAVQRGILISCTNQGELLLTRANATGKPVDSIEEEKVPYQELEITFDGRKRHSTYRAIGQSPQIGPKNVPFNVWKAATSEDVGVPRSRFVAFRANNANLGNIQTSADWKRNRTLAEALTIPFAVSSWYTKDGELWQPNTLVTVKSPTLFIPEGFDFLIRAVEYISEPDRVGAILSLVPPQVYTDEDIVEPWAAAKAEFSAQSMLDKLKNEM